jgi:hypothetical protein
MIFVVRGDSVRCGRRFREGRLRHETKALHIRLTQLRCTRGSGLPAPAVMPLSGMPYSLERGIAA